MKVCAEAIFEGYVQGVHFRDYTQKFAREKGVNGWVKNLPDGTVGAMFEGEKADIEEVIRMLKEEHPFARVDKIGITWSGCKEHQDGFDILH
jgi:acylphosphatase